MKKIEVIYKNTDELIPYVNNPRFNDNAVDAVASSIKNFGFKQPIVIDNKNEIVAGHTRLLASKKLGLEEVPVIIADDLNESQARAYRLADNKVAEIASWDYELLELELETVETDDLNLDMEELGFEDNSIDISYIDELSEEGLSMTKGQNEYFSMSLSFPIEKQALIDEYISEVTKDKIVNDIILAAEGLNNA